MKWVAFFSQSGSEIVEISERLGVYPDVVITNQQDQSKINKKINKTALIHVPSTPSADVYRSVLGDASDKIVTLNGWLRIIPSAICDEYTMYNGHPGLITKYPELKGKDPQKKAVHLSLPTSGAVIHEVTSVLDGGTVLASDEISIEDLDTNEVISRLHKISVNLWVTFLKQKLNTTTAK